MILKEQKGDLFDLPSDYALVHCISEDCAMGAGIAVEFERRFRLRPMLKEFMRIKPGHYPRVIWTDVNGRLIFNMITKGKYWHKPTCENFETALEELAELCRQLKVRKLGMPRIGCGLDHLKWNWVKQKIEETFADLDIEIRVRYL